MVKGVGGARRVQVLCRWKIWLLSTSAVLNTGTYLSPPQSERSLLFAVHLRAAAFSRTQFCSKPSLPSLIYLHLAFHAYFSFFNLFSSFLHTHTPHLPHSLSSPGALGGTAHSATKQSCLQHHTAANQARPECSGFVVHSNSDVEQEGVGDRGPQGDTQNNGTVS